MAGIGKRNGRTVSMGAGIGTGLLMSMLTILIGAAVIAVLVEKELLAWEQIGYGILVLLPVSAAIGAQTACSRIRRQRMAVCLISAASLWAALLLITALFFGAQYEAVGVSGGLIIAGSGCVLLLGGREKTGGKRPNMKKLTR